MRSAVVDVGHIRATDRIRSLNDKTVKALMDSIAEVGLLNPITVYAREIIHNGAPLSGYGLIAGAHRFEACRRLGLAEIDVVIADLGDDARIIAECDENLCGSNLSASDVAVFTKERKAAYLRLHPETARGANLKDDGVAKLATPDASPSFVADTAAKTGQSPRKVARDAERGERISPAAMALVKGTHLDTGQYLDKLKPLSTMEQIERVRSDLASGKKPKQVAPPDDDEEAETRQVAALMSAWNKAGAEARDTFLAQIGATR